MQIGILGMPKVGKTTLFNLLTGSDEETGKFAASQETNLGVARVPDRRLEALRDLFQPKKYTQATVDYVDIPGLKEGEGRDSLDLGKLRAVDGLVHVVRAFDDLELPHPGGVDPVRDVETIDLELVFADYELVQRRLDRLAQAKKRGLRPEETREQELLAGKVIPWLESERPLRELELEESEEKSLRGFQLLSAKPMLLVVNVDEGEIGESPDRWSVAEREGRRVIVVSAPIEAEISRLDADAQAEFLADLGLDEPSLDRVIRASFDLLGLIAFFTVGEDEVRAWTVRGGSSAKVAAGAIHTDLERGFIRAEVVGWEDVVRTGSMAGCRSEGCLRLEGKEYVVRDGDVVHVRFNV